MLRGKRLLSLLLCLVMVLSFFPTALAEGEGDAVILEDERDHEHEHEGEDQESVPPEIEETVGGDLESPDGEPAEESVEADAPGGPEDEEPAEDEKNDLVRVEFICDPEDAVITVYDPSQLDENGEPLVIAPEEDGTWLLTPGEYWYDAEREGYQPAEKAFCFVPEQFGVIYINVYLDSLISQDGFQEMVCPGECDEINGAPAGAGSRTFEGGRRDFKWPVPSAKGISSCFKDGRNHDAIDIAGASRGASVVASYNGTVCEVGYGGGYGNYVIIRHNYTKLNGETTTLYTKYNHLNSYSVSNGQSVLAGVTIAGVGNSGGDYGLHLDFQIMTSQDWGNYNYHNISIDPYVNDLLELPSDVWVASTSDCCGVGPTACCCKKYLDYVKELYSVPLIPTYYLDLNGYLDGKSVTNLGEYGSADVFINGQLDASWVNDYYKQWPTGTTYEIRCRTNDGYLYNGVHSSGASAIGTIGNADVDVVLSYSTACSVTYKNSSGDITKTIPKGEYTVEATYDKLGNSYFIGWSYSPNATMFDVRPGEKIDVTGDVTLYPVYISHAEATSGQPVLIYDISDFPAEGYNITQTTKDVSVTTTESDWGAWSDWSTTAVSSSDTVQVESRTAYGWYYFECPNCHAHMHGYGTCWTWCGGCGATTTASGWHQMYDPTNWSGAKDWYGTGKYYATINGETWFKWDDGGTQTQYRSRKLVTNTTTTTKTYTAYVIRPAVGYTVSFDANGGTGAPEAQSKYQGQTLTLSTTRPTRPCHVFVGWATSKTATTAQYQPGGSFTTDANTVLYAVWKEGTQSEWSTTKPSGVDDSLIETKTQYRYADKETTTSDQSTLDGWTLYDTKTSWSDWGNWSNWSESSATASDSCQVETRTAYGYYYYVCSNCGAHMHGYGTCYSWAGGCGKNTISSGSYHSVYLVTPYSSSSDFHGTGANYVDSSSDGRVFAYTNPSNQYYRSPITQYRYRTRTLNYTYYYYRWKAWSDWSDTVYTANDDRKVETRTLYRYVQSGDVHQWDNGKVTKAATCTTKGVMTYTCSKCGKTKTTDIAATGHSWGTPSYAWSSDYKTVVASRTCSHDGSHVDTETVNTVPTVSTQPTCTALGKTTYTATFSNSAFAKQTKTVENIAALGHNWGEWKVTTPATVDQDGVQTRTCSRCSATETRSYAADTVTVTYNANGGSVSPTSIKILKGGNISNLPTPTRTGYTFNGWFTAASGGTKVTTSTTFSADTTIYAQWTIITYTIKFDANGGTGAPGNQTKTYGTALTLSSTKPSRANASAGSYTVTLNANGGSVSTDKLTAARTTSYTFKNWNTAANGGGTSYNPGASYTANAAATLYAQWNSSTTTAAVTLPTPTRTGYSFKGWATSASATDGSTGNYTPTGNVTLYAIWKQDQTTEGTLSLGTARGSAGSEVVLEVKLDKNPGIMMLSFRLDYDKSKLQYLGGEDGSLTGWTFSTTGSGALWDGDKDYKATGTIVKLRFKILDNAKEGDVVVNFTAVEAWNYSEREILFGANAGKVTISNRIPGDVTGDGKVNGMDLVRLRKYLAGDSVEIDLSNADVTGDGKVNGMDLIRLRKFLAGDNVILQ